MSYSMYLKAYRRHSLSFFFLSFVVFVMSGCAPALLAGGAAAGYYVGKDQRSVGEILDDAGITAAINAKFVKDPNVSAFDINVDTRNGVVTLYGSVANTDIEDQAIYLAQQVKGVRKIISKLTVVQKSG